MDDKSTNGGFPNLLQSSHELDCVGCKKCIVFVIQCKDGPTLSHAERIIGFTNDLVHTEIALIFFIDYVLTK